MLIEKEKYTALKADVSKSGALESTFITRYSIYQDGENVVDRPCISSSKLQKQ